MASRSKIFDYASVRAPGRSVFDLSYEKHMTCDMGLLYPCYEQEVYPGDSGKIGASVFIRMQPTVSPQMTEINAYIHYFFVPNRILWDKWETFYTRGKNGDVIEALPKWRPTGQLPTQLEKDKWLPILGYEPVLAGGDFTTLWDYFGLPPRCRASVLDFPRRAYIKIWNDYYRDANIIDELPLEDSGLEWLLPRAWPKDYFTSALPWQQRGIAPALPLTGLASAMWPDSAFNLRGAETGLTGSWSRVEYSRTINSEVASPVGKMAAPADDATRQAFAGWFNSNQIDLSRIGTMTVPDFRLMYAVQVLQEINARAGARYNEQIEGHFGVKVSDARVQRAEYIGGIKVPINISEVVQTSATQPGPGGTPQGNLAGHGLGANGDFCGDFFCEEHGWVIGILSIMPKAGYQQGIHRSWLRESSYDYYYPVFANLSEQAVDIREVYCDQNVETQSKVFAFQGRFDELRVRQNQVVGQMRKYDTAKYPTSNWIQDPGPGKRPVASLAHWNSARFFENEPAYNWEFLICRPRLDNFAVPSEPGFIIQMSNNVEMVRPLPYQAEPGLGFV